MSTPSSLADRNLLFGVLALQADLIDNDQFAKGCALWAAEKRKPLADILADQGWLTAEDHADVEKLLARKLNKHKGDVRASLAEVTTDPVRQSLAGLADDEVRQSLAPTPAQPGHVLLGTTAYVPEARERYTLSRLHATGGIGRVWLARDANLARDVALKELRPERSGNPAVWARFLKEAQITGQLEHPGIVPIYEVGKRPDDQAPFYTMRFVRGRTLSQAVSIYHQKHAQGEATPLELRELLGAFVGVCNAVAYAHSRGVLHRDLKPKNVVLGDYGEVIVLDWGLARLMDQPDGEDAAPLEVSGDTEEQATIQGQVLGTPAYMAPEQAEGRLDQHGPPTDVYGLGAILYEMLSGQPPFSGSETTEVLRKVIHEPPVRPSSLVSSTPKALEAVCLKALAKKPAQRYHSVSELANEIRHFLADEPVSAYPDPLLARMGRKARRHRTLVAGLAAAALVAVVSLTAATVLLSAANRRESEARILAQQRGEEAERESIKAQANFQMARDAVEEYCSKVSNDPRLKEKDLEGLRKELLQSAVKFHQKFVEQHGDDPALRADLGRAYLDLGKLLGEVDRPSRATAVCRQAVAIYEQLAAEHPESSHEVQLAQALKTLAVWLDDEAQYKEATDACYRALELLEAERRRQGYSQLLRQVFLRTSIRLAYLLVHKAGQQVKAIEVYRKAVGYLEQNDEVTASEPGDMARTAELYARLAETLANTGQSKEAKRWSAKALDMIKPLTTKASATTEVQIDLADVYNMIGRVHIRLAEWPNAIATFRKAVDLNFEIVTAHAGVRTYQESLGNNLNDLFRAQRSAGQNREAFESLKKSVEIKEDLVKRYPEVPDYKANLARGLGNMTQLTADPEKARAYLHRAEVLVKELNDDYPSVDQYQSAFVLVHEICAGMHLRANKQPEALESLDRAIAMQEKLVKKSDVLLHRLNLVRLYFRTADLCLKTDKPEALAEIIHKAIPLGPTDPTVLYKFGTALMNKGRLNEAQEAFIKAVALKPDFAEAECNLGHCLVRKGRFVEGLAALQRGHELGVKQPGWKYASASWVRNAKRLIQLDGRLTAILKGDAEPADTNEQLALAQLCRRYKQLYAASARFYTAAFADNPKLAEDLKALHRYNAACAAALAGCGRGEDGGKLDDKQRAKWRKQARDWLAADLALWTKQAEKATPSVRAAIRKQLEHWQTDTDLAGVRDEKALSLLPADEQAPWRKLWADVAELLKKAEDKQK